MSRSSSLHQLNSDAPKFSANRTPIPATPAQMLCGRELKNSWYVEELIDRPVDATGGNFSTSYIVRSPDGKKAFLKAMDFRSALEAPDPSKALGLMTAAYNFERNILEKCRKKNLTRIVQVLDEGTIPPQDGDLSSVVQYLIFELAKGDIRSVVSYGEAADHAWILRTIHQAAAALNQLHRAHIAHQDLKPSNILVFTDTDSKLADLGRSFDKEMMSPHDNLQVAGDTTYAPPELLYGYLYQEEWPLRRLAPDLYLLGSLILYLYANVSLTHFLLSRVERRHHYSTGIGYAEVLPYLQHAFAQILRELPNILPTEVADPITEAVGQLCNLEPEKRGHPKNHRFGTNRFSLERYVSLFDLLATKASWTSRRILRSVQID